MQETRDSMRQPLSRSRICEAALETIDNQGLPALSMRSLAFRLGVKASSLYYYYESKEELLADVTEMLYEEVGPLPETDNWQDLVRGMLLQVEAVVQAHPRAASLLIRGLPYSESGQRWAEGLTKAVVRSGMEGDACANLIYSLFSLLAGHSLAVLWLNETLDRIGAKGDELGDLAAGSPWLRRMLTGDPPLAGTLGDGEAQTALDLLADPVLGLPFLRAPMEREFQAGLDALIAGFDDEGYRERGSRSIP